MTTYADRESSAISTQPTYGREKLGPAPVAWSRRLLFVVLGVASALAATNVSAGPLAVVSSTSILAAYDDSTFGWGFTTGSIPIKVTQLGFFDFFEDGLNESHQIGLWRASDGDLLSSATVPSGTTATLIDGFRYVSTTPVVLEPNTNYVLGAHNITEGAEAIQHTATVSMSYGATFGGARATNPNAGFILPTFGLNPDFEKAFFGPNLTAVNVPEPSTIAMGVLGAFGLGAWGIRRRARGRSALWTTSAPVPGRRI